MQNTHLIRLALAVLIISYPVLFFAQQNLRPGFIITNDQDTVYGQIDFRTDAINSKHCLFQQKGQNDFHTYLPFEIKAYRFTDDGKYYVSSKIKFDPSKGETSVFLECLLQGMRSVYYYINDKNEFAYFIEYDGKLAKADAPTIEKEHKKGQLKRYIPVMQYVFKDCPKLNKKIENMSYNSQDFINIAKEYHYAMCKTGEDCIEFEANTKAGLKFEITPYMGIVYYDSEEYDFKHQPDIFGGINLEVSNPRFSNYIRGVCDLAFARKRVTVHHTDPARVWDENYDGCEFTIKVGARFIYSKKTVQPFVEAGGGFYPYAKPQGWDLYPGFYVGAGTKVRMPKTKKQSIILRLQVDQLSFKGRAYTLSAALGYAF